MSSGYHMDFIKKQNNYFCVITGTNKNSTQQNLSFKKIIAKVNLIKNTIMYEFSNKNKVIAISSSLEEIIDLYNYF